MSAVDEKQLGRRVQAARQAAGLTQQALCQKARLSYSTLAKIERGAIKTPSIFTIQSIATVLGITLDELVGAPAPTKRRDQSKSGVKFVFFDVNNTLVRFWNRAFTKIAAEHDISPDSIEAVFWRFNDQICRGDITMEEFNTQVAKQLRLPRFDWRDYYLTATEPMPEMVELVRWVGEHYGVGLLTNSMPGLLPEMQARGLLPDVPYDIVIDSSAVGLLKPERAIYELAQTRSGYKPAEILFTDDTRANVLAAHQLGWHTALFDGALPDDSAARLRAALEPLTT